MNEWQEVLEELHAAKSIIKRLNEFWSVHRIAGKKGRLRWLRRLAKLKFRTGRNYKDLREHKYPYQGKCWVCDKSEAFFHHHIITLKNGGLNSRRNLIPCCNSCHSEIHPWIKTSSVRRHKEKKQRFVVPKGIRQLDEAFKATVE